MEKMNSSETPQVDVIEPVEKTTVETPEKPIVYDRSKGFMNEENQTALRAQRIADEAKRNKNAITKILGKIGDYFAKLDEDTNYGVNKVKDPKPKGDSSMLGNHPEHFN